MFESDVRVRVNVTWHAAVLKRLLLATEGQMHWKSQRLQQSPFSLPISTRTEERTSKIRMDTSVAVASVGCGIITVELYPYRVPRYQASKMLRLKTKVEAIDAAIIPGMFSECDEAHRCPGLSCECLALLQGLHPPRCAYSSCTMTPRILKWNLFACY